MDFIRFTGELFIYYVLIALGGGVLMALSVGIFEAIGIKMEPYLQNWIVPCGAVGAAVIATWLVEAKQSVIENMAPVLTRIFAPLFALLLIAFIVTMATTGRAIDVKREILILFDLLLVVVFGLLLYSVSARDSIAPPGLIGLDPADAGRDRAGGGRPGALGHREPDLRVRVHAQPGRGPGREHRPAGQPGRFGDPLRRLPPGPRSPSRACATGRSSTSTSSPPGRRWSPCSSPWCSDSPDRFRPLPGYPIPMGPHTIVTGRA